MIAQEIFDQVVAHLGRQRARSIDRDTGLCHLGAAARKFSLQWKPEVYGEY